MPPRIPIARPDLSGNEEKYVVDAIRSSWISSTGPYIDRFEREFAGVCRAKHCAVTSSGTTALHLALRVLDIRPGDEVLVPSLTYVAVANAVRYVGAEPVFVDVDGTWCIDPGLLEESITRRTKGVIAVHLYGHPADMDAINAIAAVHGLWVVEDAAEAHFARYKDRPVGNLGHVGIFSFYGNKILSSGEGGAVIVDDSRLDTRVRALRGQGVDPSRRYFFPTIGYNYRLTNVAAALLCAQLERAESFLAARDHIYRTYDRELSPFLALPSPSMRSRPWARCAPWLYSILYEEQEDRDRGAKQLAAKGIETRPLFYPVHRLPPYAERGTPRILSVTEAVAACGLSLPTYIGLKKDEIQEICAIVRAARSRRL